MRVSKRHGGREDRQCLLVIFVINAPNRSFHVLPFFWTQVDLCALLAGRGLLLRQFLGLRTSFRVIFPGWLVQDGT